MAKRFTCTAPSLKGVVYTLEIWDSTFSGTATTFNVSSRLFEQRISGQAEKKTTRIMGGELTFDMLIENSTHAQIIADLRTSKEDQFTLKVTTGASSPTLFWTGVIIADNTEQEDANYPYQFTIKAICGLGALKNVPYYDAGTLYTGTKTFVEHIKNCLTKIPSSALYASGDEFFRTSVDWWDENVTPANATDPLNVYGVDHIAFYDFHTSGGTEKDVLSCYDVLDNILTAFDARIMMVDGVYWIEQPSYRTSNYVGRKYAKTGSYLTFSAYGSQNTLNRTESGARNSGQGGTWDYYPALKKVIVNYNVFNRRNMYQLGTIVSNPYGGSFPGGSFTQEIDSSGGNSVIKATGDLSIQVINASYSGNQNNMVYAVFRVQIRIGLRYWVNTYTKDIPGNKINYTAGQWSATAGYFYLHVIINPIPNSNVGLSTSINILTQPLVQDGGDNLFTLELHAIEKAWEAGTIATSVINVWHQIPNIWLELYDQGTPDAKEDITQYTATGDAGNNIIETYDTRIGTGTSTNSVGRVRRKVGSNWVVTGNWGIGSEAKNKKLSDLLAITILRGQYTPIRKMSTVAYGSIVLYRKFVTDGVSWLFQGGTWRASDDELAGDFYEINYGTGGVNSTPVKVIQLGNNNIPIFAGNGNPTTGNTPPVTSGNPGFGSSPPPAVLYPVSNNALSAPVATGSITSLPVVTALTGNDYAINDIITIVNPVTGQFDSLTITAGPTAGATAIAVSGTLTANYPQGSYLIKKPIAYAFSLPTTTKGSVLRFNRTSVKWEAYDGVTNGHVLTWDASTNDWKASAPTTVTPANVTAGSTKVTLGGTPTGAALQAFTIDVNEANLTLNNIGGTLGVAKGGTGLTALGTSLQLLRTNAAGTALEYFTFTGITGTPSNVTAGSTKVTLGGTPTGAALQAFSVDVNEANLTLNNIGGTLGVAKGGTGLTALGTSLQLLRTNAAANALEYFTFSGLTGSLTATRIPFASDVSALNDDSAFTWDNTNKRLVIGTGTSAAYINVFAGALSNATEFIRCSANVSNNMINSLINVSNTSAANAIEAISVGGSGATSNAGDPTIQFTISTVVTTAMGLDNSDSDKFKITPGASLPGGTVNQGLIITNDSAARVGINKDAPLHALDVSGRTMSNVFQNQSTGVTLVAGTGAGTSPTLSSSGHSNFIIIGLTTGTAPALNGDILTVTLGTAFTATCIPVLDGNDTYRANMASFYCTSLAAGSFKIKNRGTALPQNTYFNLYLNIGGY